ncbi:Oidioi.mRNA.OKI2018_I69.chr1.g2049.t1.cds [Oikopleura dioica]|uniref:Oidioi.mRNA.OKI2018_I69.chr1.g2049.t1.cds n=1 Tax=Oikopleura dioica TaxID=34765 RepID=A0ABN7SU27_OIKDI|nr:Oidioi.mRNA.OKI2018_I69.chr1.g2049.t1.cds [Oikopleura dioica]
MIIRFLLLLDIIQGLTSNFALNIRECPDKDLGEACAAQCRLEYVSCRLGCSDSFCDTECLNAYSACVDTCPCYHDCPSGCEDCWHPICQCKDPETTSPIYRQCKSEAQTGLNLCMNDCQTNSTCFDSCHETFKRNFNRCPCMSGCPNGCPCSNGYVCERFFTVICQNRNDLTLNYIVSGSGHFKENRYYSIPESRDEFYQYLDIVGSAALNGEIYIFGGNEDRYKISRVQDCGIVELAARLVTEWNHHYGGIVTVPSSPDEILLCFGDENDITTCEEFDGEAVRKNPFSLRHNHIAGCLATFDSFAIAISGNFDRKVEVLGLGGWRDESDHPRASQALGCLSVGRGTITIGGYDVDGGTTNEVFHFNNGVWSNAGFLIEPSFHSTSLFFDSYFVSFGRGPSFNVAERAQWNGTFVTSSEIISTDSEDCDYPIVFESAPDACSQSCDQFCFPQ